MIKFRTSHVTSTKYLSSEFVRPEHGECKNNQEPKLDLRLRYFMNTFCGTPFSLPVYDDPRIR